VTAGPRRRSGNDPRFAARGRWPSVSPPAIVARKKGASSAMQWKPLARLPVAGRVRLSAARQGACPRFAPPRRRRAGRRAGRRLRARLRLPERRFDGLLRQYHALATRRRAGQTRHYTGVIRPWGRSRTSRSPEYRRRHVAHPGRYACRPMRGSNPGRLPAEPCCCSAEPGTLSRASGRRRASVGIGPRSGTA
jgi:hypothetical protein